MRSFALGFGSTEQDFEDAEKAAIREYIERRYNELNLDYITDELVADVRDWIKVRTDEYHAAAERNRTATNYPSRYSRYWPTVVADASHMIVLMSMHHINRRHAMSPDGWACLQSEPVLVVKSYRIEKQQARAA